MNIVKVALPIPVMHAFNYQLPSNFLSPIKGRRVLVPLGKRMILGIVLSDNIHVKCSYRQYKIIKEILDYESLFSDNLLSLLIWSSKYYHYPIGEVLFHALPSLLRQGKGTIFSPLQQWQVTSYGKNTSINQLRRSPKQQKALKLLQERNLYHHQINEFELSKNTLKLLKKKNLIQLLYVQPQMENWYPNFYFFIKKKELNLEQKTVVRILNSKLKFTTFVLVSKNSFSKIKVYLNVIGNVLKTGKQVLLLVPEIKLIYNFMDIFKKRFNAPIDILHSKLNNNERLAVWLRAKKGYSAIVIGTRSAVLISFMNLGLIILDEENDNAYKEQYGWRYHARDFAVMRAKKEDISIILGTETPSLESLKNIDEGKYQRLDLTEQTKSNKKLSQYLLDLKCQPLKHGISRILIQRIEDHLLANNKVLLFLNRRGYSPILICHNCSWIAECLSCNYYYTLHYYDRQMHCHRCNNQLPMPIQCLKCGLKCLITLGLGTEQLEKIINNIFPDVPVTRIDSDTIYDKKELKKKLEIIYKNGARILIGTQILAKGYICPDITLVSLLNIDSVLFASDYRAIEKFAQLYIKISNNIIDRTKNSELILQTYYPENPLLLTLIKKGYNALAIEMLAERRDVSLPPYSNHIIIRSEDYNDKSAANFLEKCRQYIEQHSMRDSKLCLIGPIPAIKFKCAGRFHWQLLLQHPSRYYLQQFFSCVLPKIMKYPEGRKIKWNIDVDPIEN
ncbi:Primosomal protein N' [Candidatus Arsenophonus lipoptenae]|uniref:Replication restart protein PriA n=1 Tax=Candidatus Arsenophonus lipoptenae TaxID=634113 RepID=A0A109Q9N8_9GAMM|nr:primosomal protein N' [Candidatus Arsenophonus lipoptenae]AMA64906.1 Primosomal protein N' [Candidatus Arsenophonus lipoptenae]